MQAKHWRIMILVLALLGLSGCASQQFTELPEPDEQELISEAEAALEQERYLLAIDYYQRALVLNPANSASRLALADLLLQKRQFAVAANHYERLMEEGGEDARVLEGLGIALLRQQRHEEAQELLERAINADYSRSLAHNYLGVIADLSGSHLLAMFHYEKAREADARNPVIINNMGFSMMTAGNHESAEALFRRALELSSGDTARIKNNLMILYATQGRFDEAIRVLSPGMNDPVAYNNVGYIALINGHHGAAIEMLERALELSPSFYQRAVFNLERAKREARR